jgi:hypothetical protein
MHLDWYFILPLVSSIGLLIGGLGMWFRPHRGWRALIIVCGVGMIAGGALSMRHQWKHDRQVAHIEAERASLQHRLDDLKGEMQKDPNPVDPSVVQSRRDRLEQLQRELNAIIKESDPHKG